MALDVILIVVGLVTTFVLAFASHDAQSRVVKTLFWLSLLVTAGDLPPENWTNLKESPLGDRVAQGGRKCEGNGSVRNRS